MLSSSSALAREYTAEKAVAGDGSVYWVVVDDAYELHVEACAYLAGLRSADKAYNTERVYAGRIAAYLTWCLRSGVDWTAPSLPQMTSLLHWLVREPIPARSAGARGEPQHREEGTANQIVGTAGGFLRWCCLQGWVAREVVDRLGTPKDLLATPYSRPPGFDAGEDGQFRTVTARTVKFRVAVPGYEWLNDSQIEALLALTRHARDRFLIHLLAETAMRIGEGLGLRREDMHFLPDSTVLGCQHSGPHVHVRRRVNANGAFAKSRMPRVIPVTRATVGLYVDYQNERDGVDQAEECDMVFVNLFRAPLGAPMRYDNAYELFKRLAARAGFRARPHMLRHSAITRMVRNKKDHRVIQEIAGHVSPSSMNPYIHVTDEDKRAAVEDTAEAIRQVRR